MKLMVWRSAVLSTLSLAFCRTADAVPWDEPSMFGFFPIRFHEEDPTEGFPECDYTELLSVINLIVDGMDATYDAYVETVWTDTPVCTMDTFYPGCYTNRVVFMSTHGGGGAEFMISAFMTTDARDIALAAVRNAYGYSYFAASAAGYPGIKMTNAGVTHFMQNQIGDNGILFNSACGSADGVG